MGKELEETYLNIRNIYSGHWVVCFASERKRYKLDSRFVGTSYHHFKKYVKTIKKQNKSSDIKSFKCTATTFLHIEPS